MILIGFDFSINKPAATVKTNSFLSYYVWPYEMKQDLKDRYRDTGVNIIDRTDNNGSGYNISEKMRNEVGRSQYLSSRIIETLKPFLNRTTYISFEGLSYASGGNVAIQLGAYKYILMDRLSKYVPIDNMYTYSPQTLKSVAGCSKKGMGKNEMIEAFIKDSKSDFTKSLQANPETFQTKKAKHWEVCIDDIADSYWALRTLEVKEALN